MKAVCIFLAGLLAAPGAFAQSLLEVEMVGQPLVYGKDGTVEGCGVRAVGVILPVQGRPTFRSFDLSANVWKSGVALAKIIGEVTPVATPEPGKGRRVALKNAWLKAEGKEAAAPIQKSFKESATEKGAYLFAVEPAASLEFILAASNSRRVQAGVNWNEATEWIYTGVIQLTEQQRQQMQSCLKEIGFL